MQSEHSLIPIPKYHHLTLILNYQAQTRPVPPGWHNSPVINKRTDCDILRHHHFTFNPKQIARDSRPWAHCKTKPAKHAQYSRFETCTAGSVYLLTVVMLAPPFPALSQHVTESKEQKPPLLHSAQRSPVATKPLNSLRWGRTCWCISHSLAYLSS